jgi:NhaP-type Na+/H+ or K+/H+ antiporter
VDTNVNGTGTGDSSQKYFWPITLCTLGFTVVVGGIAAIWMAFKKAPPKDEKKPEAAPAEAVKQAA